MEPSRLPLPVRGASDVPAFTDQTPDTCPPGAIRNVEVFAPPGGRAQLGMRRGHRRTFPRALGTGPGQALLPCTRVPSVTGYVLSKGSEIGGGASRLVEAYQGNVWMLDDVPTLDREAAFKPDGVNRASNACAWSQDGTRLAVGVNTVAGDGRTIGVVGVYDTTGALVFSRTLAIPFPFHSAINSLVWSKNWLWACAGPHIFRIAKDNASWTYFYPGWTKEVVQVTLLEDDQGVERLYPATDGFETPGTLVGYGLMTEPYCQQQTRSGIHCFRINEGATGSVLIREQFGLALDPAAAGYESNHGYMRVSELPVVRPYGCNMLAVAAGGPFNEIAFTRTNQGFGPTGAYRPNGTARPPFCVGLLATDGTLEWMVDQDSLNAAGMGFGYYESPPGTPVYHYNDINTPTYESVAINGDGDVYIAGRQNRAGFSVLKLSGEDGRMLWRQNVVASGGQIRQAAIAVNPTNGNVIVGGDRNNVWPGATGQAHIWELSSVDGSIVNTFDVGKAVSVLGVSVKADGSIAYVTDYAT